MHGNGNLWIAAWTPFGSVDQLLYGARCGFIARAGNHSNVSHNSHGIDALDAAHLESV
jgi:hypothetical protein